MSKTVNIFERVVNAISRIDYLLTYNIVGFIQQRYSQTMHPNDMLYSSLVLVICTYKYDFVSDIGNSITDVLGFIIHKISSIVLTSQLVGLTNVNDDTTSTFNCIVYWTIITVTVVIISTVNKTSKQTMTGAQVNQLILFMYAENASKLFVDNELRRIIPSIALITLAYMHEMNSVFNEKHMQLFTFLLKALSMLVMNILVNTTLGVTDNETTTVLDCHWLVVMLIIFDHVEVITQQCTELRDYATWAVSHQVQQVITSSFPYNSLIVVMALGVCYIFIFVILEDYVHVYDSKTHTKPQYGVCINLCILIIMNELLNSWQTTLQNTPVRIANVVTLCCLVLTETCLHIITA